MSKTQIKAYLQVVGFQAPGSQKVGKRLSHAPLLEIDDSQAPQGLGAPLIDPQGVQVINFRRIVLPCSKIPVGPVYCPGLSCLSGTPTASDPKDSDREKDVCTANIFRMPQFLISLNPGPNSCVWSVSKEATEFAA